MGDTVLEIKDLSVNFATDAGVVKAVDRVSLALAAGETFGLVGESGCGKSVTALSILRLIPSPPGKISGGEIRWRGRNLLSLPVDDLVGLRGKEIGFVFQEPMTSFNPVQRIGAQIGEALEIHSGLTKAQVKERVLEALETVEISNAAQQYQAFPHELSGGMRQRAMIAMALINNPRLLIADEPTTALDVTIQAQILDLMVELQKKNGMATLLITHNLGVIATTADRVAVMYCGKIVETAGVVELFRRPAHPYTSGLLQSIPRITATESLKAIPGQIPDSLNLPQGCYFAPRCPRAIKRCRVERPPLQSVAPGHEAACWLNY